MKTYSLEELMDIAASEAVPEARRLAVELAYGRTLEPSLRERTERLTALLEPTPVTLAPPRARGRMARALRRREK